MWRLSVAAFVFYQASKGIASFVDRASQKSLSLSIAQSTNRKRFWRALLATSTIRLALSLFPNARACSVRVSNSKPEISLFRSTQKISAPVCLCIHITKSTPVWSPSLWWRCKRRSTAHCLIPRSIVFFYFKAIPPITFDFLKNERNEESETTPAGSVDLFFFKVRREEK